jgi:hypothetical protein
MKHCTKLSLLAAAGIAGLLITTPASAQSCPADVSDLASQIQEPELQDSIYEPLDTIASNAGGLDEAIAQWRQKLSDAQANKAVLSPNSPAVLTRALDEQILILGHQLDGLRCRATG